MLICNEIDIISERVPVGLLFENGEFGNISPSAMPPENVILKQRKKILFSGVSFFYSGFFRLFQEEVEENIVAF